MGETKVYFLVIEHIKSLVQQGTLSFGGKLPSERQLMTTLGLSRNSIREALRSLENMGPGSSPLWRATSSAWCPRA